MAKFIGTFVHIIFVTALLSGCSKYEFVNGINMAFKNDPVNDTRENSESLEQACHLYKKGDYKKAVALYEKAIDENSTKENLLSYAESLRLSNDCTKAITIYERVLGFDANDIDAVEGKGLCHIIQGKFQGAAELLSQVVKQDASRWKSVNALGVIYALKGHMDESMEYYNLAIKNSGHNPSVLNNIGLSLAFGGDYNRGRTILEKSLSFVDEEDAEKRKNIELNLALIYGLAGKTDMAQSLLSKHFSEAQVMNNLGFYASLANDKELARSYLSKALSISTTHYDKAWNNLQALDSDFSG